MLYTLDYEENVVSRLGTKKEIVGDVFSVKDDYWIISCPKREKVKVNHFCPARKGDKFCAIGTLIEEDPDLWNIEHPPMVKIVLNEDGIKAMLKTSFRCSKERSESVYFHLMARARNYKMDLNDYIDETIGCYLRVPCESVLDLMFPKEKKENVLRFFRYWSSSMIRRIELLGIKKEKLREMNKPPSEIYRVALDNPFNLVDLDMKTTKEVMARINKPYTLLQEQSGSILRYINNELENGNVYVNYEQLVRKFNMDSEQFYDLENLNIYADRETRRVFMKNAYDANVELASYLYEKCKSDCPQRAVDTNLMNPSLNFSQTSHRFSCER